MADFSSAIWNKPAAAAAAADDVVTKSLRFNYSDSAYILHTPSTSGNRRTFTWSAWIKRAKLGSAQSAFTAYGGDTMIFFQYDDTFLFNIGLGVAVHATIAKFRDTAAWYHFVVAIDSTQSTAADRVKIYVNNELMSLTVSYQLGQNVETDINNNVAHYFGRLAYTSGYYTGLYLADAYLIDGTALTPTSFATEDGTTGQWKPKAYSGSYGTNGFHLDFKEDSPTSGSNAGIGKDVSGNGNYFDTTNLAASDVVEDTPTDNYAVLNVLDKGTVVTLSEGNTVLSNPATSSGWRSVRGTIGVTSGKYYFEVNGSWGGSSRGNFGIDINQRVDVNGYGGVTSGIVFGLYDGNLYENGVSDTGHTQYQSGTHNVGVAFDVDAGKVWFRIDGSSTWETNSAGSASGDPATASSIGTATFTAGSLIHPLTSTFGQTATLRFGQSSDWSYEPPTDFLALSTANLPTPTIAKPAEHFDVLTYASSGAKTFDNGTTSMQPDLVWVKARGNAYDHELTDSVRGVTKALSSNDDGTESTDSTGLTAFGSDGFTVGAGTNYSTSAMVAWSWKAGTSFDAGGGSGTGSKNVDAGFSIAKWTGDDDDFSGSSQTITHGLGVVPEMIIAKGRTDNDGMGSNWFVYHKDLDSDNYLILNSSVGQQDAYLDVIDNIGTSSADFGTDSSVIHFNYGGDSSMPIAADTYVAYFFASKAGYSKIGSWVGTGSASTAPFIYTGFRPAYVIHKEIDTSSYNWVIHDSARDPYNDDPWNHLIADRSDEENGDNTGPATNGFADFVSNGFNLNSASVEHGNGSGKTYIYIAFAESPLKYANAR